VTERSAPARPATAWNVLALGCELALLVALAVAGWRGADALLPRIGLAVLLPAFAITVWGMWTAPRSAARLGARGRLLVQIALFALAAAALSAVGLSWEALGLGIVGVVDCAVLVVRERGR
jgi:Protein of unknown function (DUF2568)